MIEKEPKATMGLFYFLSLFFHLHLWFEDKYPLPRHLYFVLNLATTDNQVS